MNKVLKSLTLSFIITAGPVVLLLLSTLTLGIVSYRMQSTAAIGHAVELAKVGARPILNLMRASVGGGNYANVQDSEALGLYSVNDKLRFFSVTGNTDRNNMPFGVLYDAVQSQVFRTEYPENYITEIEQKLKRAEAKLDKLPTGHRIRPRLEKIVASMGEQRQRYQESKTLQDKVRKIN